MKNTPTHCTGVQCVLRMKILKKETIVKKLGDGKPATVELTELEFAHDIIRPVYVQPMPKIRGRKRGTRMVLNTFVPFAV